MKHYKDILALESNLIKMEEVVADILNKDYCQNCHKPIEDYEDVEFTGTEVIFTHRCDCGRYAEIHYRLTFDRIDVIEEGAAANDE